MTFVFRCDAGPQIGFGHMTRCCALAAALHERGHDCIMVGPDPVTVKSDARNLFCEWLAVPHWDECVDAEQLVSLIVRRDCRFLVLDDYRVDERYQLVLRRAGVRWLQFDGTASRPLWANVILVPNLALNQRNYGEVARSPGSVVLTGPQYTLLRPEILEMRHRTSGDRNRVLISFGAGDDRGAMIAVIDSLMSVAPASVDFVIMSGAANPRNSEISAWIRAHGYGRVNLVIEPESVGNTIASCGIAILAGGGTSIEAAFLGIPMILVSIADNQMLQCGALEKAGAAFYIGSLANLNLDNLRKTFMDLHLNASIAEDMSRSGRRLVDGLGAARVAEVIG